MLSPFLITKNNIFSQKVVDTMVYFGVPKERATFQLTFLTILQGPLL